MRTILSCLIHANSNRWLLSLVVLLFILPACRKVDDHKNLVEAQPWLADEYPLGGTYGQFEWKYPQVMVVGDTAILIGKLFAGKPGSEIRVGDVPVKLIDHIEVDPNKQYTNYGLPYEIMDVVRFVVTKEMGLGASRPVTVTANGNTVSGPAVAVQEFAQSAGKTDTTLIVDQLAHWLPANAGAFSSNGYALVRSIHCDKTGNIWFDNQLGINQVTGGQVNNIFKAGDQLKDDQGAAITLKQVLGSAISFDGSTLFFSIENTEPSIDTAANYIFRLCKMDVATRNITTINRTLVKKGTVALSEDGSPYQGNVDHLKVVAMFLNTDVQNNLFYTNYYAPGDVANAHTDWETAISSGTINTEAYGKNLMIICRLDITGRVKVLMSAPYFYDMKPSYTTPGEHVVSSIYLLDPSGRYVYGFANFADSRTLTLQYDIQQEAVVATVKSPYGLFAFRSYDTIPATKYTGTLVLPVDWGSFIYALNNVMPQSDGSMLGILGGSLYSFNIQTLGVYCYAGVENGNNAPAPGQNKLTGKAKWVDFSHAVLIGQDKTNAVYYCNGYADYTNGVDFYKLHPVKH
ncbi:hypothetical protein CLV51_1011654 [Chitinophaga niastensis]|uniref:Uncharacterized protein n=1 Tax=Chitinophaga niastensis TaxID=536980 RepID=A0A2P8HVR4_CHINA|nr:hypothetical protein [Chitinophaga niastensis]PSL50310.1 hypothetical protein CLV51_1011654 [Chitinophaga niastensis]